MDLLVLARVKRLLSVSTNLTIAVLPNALPSGASHRKRQKGMGYFLLPYGRGGKKAQESFLGRGEGEVIWLQAIGA